MIPTIIRPKGNFASHQLSFPFIISVFLAAILNSCQHRSQQAQGNACLRVACVFCLVAALIFLAVVLAKLYQLFYLLLTDQVGGLDS